MPQGNDAVVIQSLQEGRGIPGELFEQSAPPSGNERKCQPSGNLFITCLKVAEITKPP